jgi:flagella basal body P-ring formation protein FlgA
MIMMKKFYFYTLCLFAFNAFCIDEKQIENTTTNCSIEMFSKIYRFERNQVLSVKDIIQKTNCENSVGSKISQIISNSNGTIGVDFLKRELVKDFSKTVFDITPRKLSLLDLNLAFRDQLTNATNLYFQDSKSLNGIKTIGTLEDEQLKVYCESCTSFGEKNIKVEISGPLYPTVRTLWFSSKIMAKVKVYKAKRNLSFQQKHLESDDFYEDEILTSNPDNVVTSLQNIQFFKANRTILQGSSVSNLDLQPVNLVNYGTPVIVTLKNSNINLQKSIMPSRSAQFGETIELKNPTSNKIIAGKVVDYNKVVIEL